MDKDTQLRPTLWPGVPVPMPLVWRAVDYSVDRCGWVHWFGSPWELAAVPDELVLRELLDVDPRGDRDVVVDFVFRHGLITRPAGDMLPVEAADLGERPKGAIHERELRLYLAVMRAAVRHWLAYQMGDDVVAPWREELGVVHDDRFGPGWVVGDADDAWFRLLAVINRGCEGYAVRLELPGGPDPDRMVGEPRFGLFSAMCLQLVNVMAEDLPPRKCSNETCGHYFVHQQGRAQKGVRRSGAVYCTNSCARAQAERERRRRQRKGKQ